ncbi:sugar phosphate isomerase/epimerase family protein [Marinilabilia rubra]|uniref:Sugar phosphate isomerase n=1 Tax=Marinilabilia rubra TaxID=2162893 RepID=A0A2U2BDK4_9BACT|nr:sugar phosphate isomerase/epimerase [Marinilabilia rubra]PWE01141.1 sugar phosphate isomerase [Marinilabilia rubra]
MKKSVIILLFILLATNFTMCTSSEPPKEIGLQLYSVRNSMKEAPKETVRKVGEMGYAFIEAAGYGDGEFYGMNPLEFKALVETSGMKFISSHTGRALPDSANWDKTMEWWDQCIDAHLEAGVKYIVQPWMGEQGYNSLEGLKKYCEYFNAVGQKCREKGIEFGYHNHDGEFAELEGEVIYDYMLQNTNPENVFFQLDLYWIKEGGKDAVYYFNEYPGRFLLWHVKDEKELGASGDMDFESSFELAGKAGVQYLIVEVEKYNFDPLESVEKSLQYLQNADFVESAYVK